MKAPSKYKGVLFIMLAAFCFSCMNACVRLSGEIPTIQKTFFRNLVALIIAAGILCREQNGFRLAHRENLLPLLNRSIFGTLGMLANFYAVDHLTLSDASMLNKMAPFFAVIASFFILKEKLSSIQGLSLIGAFTGAMFIVKPTLSNMDLFPSVIGLLGGLCAGVAYTLVRLLGQRGERSSYIVFAFSSFSCLSAVPFLLFDYTPMTLQQTLTLLGAGFFAAGGQFSVTAAYTNAPAREISVFDYSQVIFGALLGFFIFGDVPDGFSFIGYLLIFAMAAMNFIVSNRKVKA